MDYFWELLDNDVISSSLIVALVFYFGAAVGLSFIPANMAKRKGYSFGGFYCLSFFVSFVVTVIIAAVVKDKMPRPQYVPYVPYGQYPPYAPYGQYPPYAPYGQYPPYAPYGQYPPYAPYGQYPPYAPYVPPRVNSCPRCSAALSGDDPFCPKCGARVKSP